MIRVKNHQIPPTILVEAALKYVVKVKKSKNSDNRQLCINSRPICEHLPRIKVRPLLHERAHGEPEAVGEGEVVLDDVARVHARVRGRPLVRRKSV